MNSTARALGAVAAAALLAACGGETKAPGQQAAGGGSGTSAPAPAGTPGAPGAQAPNGDAGAPSSGAGATAVPPAPGGQPKPGATTGPGGSAAPAAAPTSRSPQDMKASHVALDVTLAKACVQPGGTQTLSFRARPRMRVIGNTGYADRQDGTVHGGRFTDVNTDDTGFFTTTWTVSATAPQGEASVQVAAVDSKGTASAKKSFTVSAVC